MTVRCSFSCLGPLELVAAGTGAATAEAAGKHGEEEKNEEEERVCHKAWQRIETKGSTDGGKTCGSSDLIIQEAT